MSATRESDAGKNLIEDIFISEQLLSKPSALNVFNVSACDDFLPQGWNPQRDATEIIIEIKQFNPGRMASHSLIESIWCSHWAISLPSKMDF